MAEGKGRGGSGLGDLFRGLADLIEVVRRLEEEGKTTVTRSGELRLGGKDLRGIYGFSVKLGLGGEPTFERFGNIRQSEAGPVVEEVREPLVDVFDEGDHLRILAELPGVAAGDISVEVRDDMLSITAKGPDRRYSKEVLLPAKARPGSLHTSYRNGILEITVAKLGGAP